MRISDWSSDVCSSDLACPRLWRQAARGRLSASRADRLADRAAQREPRSRRRSTVSDAARPASDPSPGHSLGTVERAYQLARSGRFTRLEDLRRALMHEGYAAVQQQDRKSTSLNS